MVKYSFFKVSVQEKQIEVQIIFYLLILMNWKVVKTLEIAFFLIKGHFYSFQCSEN